MKILGALLAAGSCFCAFCGLLLLSQATVGVGVIGFGAILGIIARLCQAETHNAVLQRKIFDVTNNIEITNRILSKVQNDTDVTKRILIVVHNVEI